MEKLKFFISIVSEFNQGLYTKRQPVPAQREEVFFFFTAN